MADTLTNYPISLVATAPSPATSGTSLVVTAAEGAFFPSTAFYATVCPAGTAPTRANAEIVRVTARSTDTMTITRAAGAGTTARTIVAGDQFFQCLPAEYFLQPVVTTLVANGLVRELSAASTDEGVAFRTSYNANANASGGLGNEAYNNDVVSSGWNISATVTGVPEVAGKVATYITQENKYFNGAIYGSEWHREHIDTGGTTHRFESYFLPHISATGSEVSIGVDGIRWEDWAGNIKAEWDLTGAVASFARVKLVLGPNAELPSDTLYVQDAAGNTGVRIKGGAAQTGPFFAIQTSAGVNKFTVDQNFDTNVTGGLNVSGLTSVGSLTATGLVTGNALALTGNRSAAAWTVNGLLIGQASAALTDTTSSGTVTAAYTNQWGGAAGGHFIAASSATTFTDYFTGYFHASSASTNVTFTNSWALGAASLRIGTSNHLKVTAAGVLTAISPVFTTPTIGVAAFTQLNGGSGTTPMQIGASLATNYSAISFNNVVTTTGINGIWGGNDGVLVFNVPTGGSLLFRINNATAYTMTAAGNILGSGVLACTTGTFTTGATFPILIHANSNDGSYGAISLNNDRSNAGICGWWGGPSGALVTNIPTGGTAYWRVNNATIFTMASTGLTMGDGTNVILATGTGTKIGTGTTQKLGFYNATPVVQGASVADATDAGSAITQLNALISRIEALGLIATV